MSYAQVVKEGEQVSPPPPPPRKVDGGCVRCDRLSLPVQEFVGTPDGYFSETHSDESEDSDSEGCLEAWLRETRLQQQYLQQDFIQTFLRMIHQHFMAVHPTEDAAAQTVARCLSWLCRWRRRLRPLWKELRASTATEMHQAEMDHYVHAHLWQEFHAFVEEEQASHTAASTGCTISRYKHVMNPIMKRVAVIRPTQSKVLRVMLKLARRAHSCHSARMQFS